MVSNPVIFTIIPLLFRVKMNDGLSPVSNRTVPFEFFTIRSNLHFKSEFTSSGLKKVSVKIHFLEFLESIAHDFMKVLRFQTDNQMLTQQSQQGSDGHFRGINSDLRQIYFLLKLVKAPRCKFRLKM